MSDTMYKVSDSFVKVGYYMSMFIAGIVTGLILFGVIASVYILNRMQAQLNQLTNEVHNINKALQMTFLKINKIEKITQTTMDAAETFVDGLRASAEQIQQQIIRPNRAGPMSPDTFDDLRESFEDGIKDMENDMNDNDEDTDEPKEPWK